MIEKIIFENFNGRNFELEFKSNVLEFDSFKSNFNINDFGYKKNYIIGIYSANGVGKSYILQTLNALFNLNFNYITKKKIIFDKIEIIIDNFQYFFTRENKNKNVECFNSITGNKLIPPKIPTNFHCKEMIIYDKFNDKIIPNFINKKKIKQKYESILKKYYNKIMPFCKIYSFNPLKFKVHNSAIIDYISLSTGEKQMFCILKKLLEFNFSGLYLIDEIEFSLHVTIQQKLIDNLNKIMKETGIKHNIILTTHSPSICSNHMPDFFEIPYE